MTATISTPCVGVCLVDPTTGWCQGCGRTLPEIARWGRIDEAERLAIMATLSRRLAETDGVEIMAEGQR